MKTVSFFVVLIFMWLANFCEAQPVIVKNVDQSNFPEIKIQFFDRNPEVKNTSSYALLENASRVPSQLKRLKDSVSSGKDILILFENSVWPEYAPPRDYFKKMLKEALPYALKKGDRFFLATFDWTRPSDGKVLEIIEGNGTDNIDELQKQISNIEAPKIGNRIKLHSTELFQALAEGVQFLSSKRGANAPAIFVFSAEFSNIYNDKYDDAEVITDSRKADIPIYALRYQLMTAKYNLQKICHDTYGSHADVEETKNVEGLQKLNEMLVSVNSRCYGLFYELTYQTYAKPDGSIHEAEIVISGSDINKFSFQSPGIIYWFKKYPWLWAIVAFIVLGAIFLVYIFMRKKSKQRASEKMEVAAKMDRIRQENEDAIAQQQQAHLKEKKRREEEEEHNKITALEMEDIKQRAIRLKALPRPPSLTNAQSDRVTISTPDFNIGRDASKTQLHINDTTVSRLHATIAFEKGPGMSPSQLEGRFFIWDNGSGNGTDINGRKIPSTSDANFIATELTSGDLIKMGNIQLVFNL